jgi:glycosyltransferase involved in cell wall biosynthesis
MRIGIDFHQAQRPGNGNCSYSRGLVEALLKIDQENEYFLYVTDTGLLYFDKFKNVSNAHLRLVPVKWSVFRDYIIGIKTRSDDLDIFHSQYIAPPFFSGQLVLMIHDISYEHFPNYFSKIEWLRNKILITRSIKKYARIITVSEFSKNDLVQTYGINPQKIAVTYNGLGNSFRVLEKTDQHLKIFKKFGIGGKYILFVGRIDARKNLSGLIKSFIILKNFYKIPHQLVIAGGKSFLPREIRRQLDLDKVNYKNEIIFTGYLPEEELPVFYNYADVFVYPSLYEGFGLPVLEAMACGCPVVASNVASIPEVLGEAGILVTPTDIDELATAIYRVISDNNLRRQLSQAGLARAALFSWEKTATETLKIYREVVNE